MTKPKLDPKLEPENPDHKVQTGDEETPTSGSNPEQDRKAIYKKARENRDLTTREDASENLDVAAIERAVAEAADDGEFEHSEAEGLSTENRKDRFASDDDHSDDADYVATETHDTDLEPESKVEPKSDDPLEIKPKELDFESVDGMVTVKIDGNEYQVPEADVTDAGGVKQYQIHRAANQRMARAATQARALQEERANLAQPQSDETADGDLPATGDLDEKAEFGKLKERLLDAAIDGTDEEFEQKLHEGLDEIRAKKEKQHHAHGASDQKVFASDQIVGDFEASYEIARGEANRLMMDEFSDIIGDKDLKKIAYAKYAELDADPANFGRTPSEMVREAGLHARFVSRKGIRSGEEVQQEEIERRREKKRVLAPTSEASRRTPAPTQKKTRSNAQYIRDMQKARGNG